MHHRKPLCPCPPSTSTTPIPAHLFPPSACPPSPVSLFSSTPRGPVGNANFTGPPRLQRAPLCCLPSLRCVSAPPPLFIQLLLTSSQPQPIIPSALSRKGTQAARGQGGREGGATTVGRKHASPPLFPASYFVAPLFGWINEKRHEANQPCQKTPLLCIEKADRIK